MHQYAIRSFLVLLTLEARNVISYYAAIAELGLLDKTNFSYLSKQ